MAFSSAARGAAGLEHPAEFAAVLAGREHEKLAGYELIAALLRQLVGDVQQLVEIVAEQHLAARPLDLRQTIQRSREIRAQLGDVGAGLLQQGPGGAALLSSSAAIKCTGSMY
jgi:hypothetical protein